jgi:hypothetical protein
MKAACAMSWNKQEPPSNGRPEFRSPSKGVQFDEGFRTDILVDQQLIVEWTGS